MHRRPVRPGRAAPPGKGVPARSAVRCGHPVVLAVGRAGRRPYAASDAAAAGPGGVGRGCLVWAVLDRASRGWRGFTITAAGTRPVRVHIGRREGHARRSKEALLTLPWVGSARRE